MKPPAKLSPAPVGSCGSSSGKPGREDAALVHHHRAIFAAFHHQSRRAHLEDLLRSAQKIVLAGKLAGFGIVDHQDVHVFQGFAQIGVGALDPVVHGVHRGQFWRAFDLMEHVALQIGSDVGQKTYLEFRIFFWQPGLKLAKTFSSVASVTRSFEFSEYRPAQKKYFPGARSRPSMSIERAGKSLRPSLGNRLRRWRPDSRA